MPSKDTSEPKPLTGEILFEPGDFHALGDRLAKDPQYNDRRLVARRKLLALAKRVSKSLAAEPGLKLDVRSSLHHPHAFNGMRVGRLWSSLFRVKSDKQKLKRVLGPELAKDLDSAHKNACLVLSMTDADLRVSFEVGPDAWYDGQNLKKRIAAEGLDGWLAELNRLDGFSLRMHDWKGEWSCGSLTTDRLEEYLGYYVPGEHRLKVERSWPVTGPTLDIACGPGVTDSLADELARLAPLYRFVAWSAEADFLFS